MTTATGLTAEALRKLERGHKEDPPGDIMSDFPRRGVLKAFEEVTTSEDDGSDSNLVGAGDDDDDGLFIGCGTGHHDDDSSSIAFSDIVLPTEENDPFLQELAEEQAARKAGIVIEESAPTPVVVIESAHTIAARSLAAKKDELIKLTHEELRERLETRLRPYMKVVLNKIPPHRPRKRPNCLFLNHLGTRRPIGPVPNPKKRKLATTSIATVLAKLPPVPVTAPSSPIKNTATPPSTTVQYVPKLLRNDKQWEEDLATDSKPPAKPAEAEKKPVAMVADKPVPTKKTDGDKQSETNRLKALKDMAKMMASNKAKNDAMKDMAAMKLGNVKDVVRQAPSPKAKKNCDPLLGKKILVEDALVSAPLVESPTKSPAGDKSKKGESNSRMSPFSGSLSPLANEEDLELHHEPLPLSLEGSFHHLTSDPEALLMLTGENPPFTPADSEALLKPAVKDTPLTHGSAHSKNKKKKQVRLLVPPFPAPDYSSSRAGHRPMLLSPEMDMFSASARQTMGRNCESTPRGDGLPPSPTMMQQYSEEYDIFYHYRDSSPHGAYRSRFYASSPRFQADPTNGRAYVTPDCFASSASPNRRTKVKQWEACQEELLMESYSSPSLLVDGYGEGASSYYDNSPEGGQNPRKSPIKRRPAPFGSNPTNNQKPVFRGNKSNEKKASSKSKTTPVKEATPQRKSNRMSKPAPKMRQTSV